MKSNASAGPSVRGNSNRAIHVADGYIQVGIPQPEGSTCTINTPLSCLPGFSVGILASLQLPIQGETESTAAYLFSSGPPSKQGVSIYMKKHEETSTTVSFYCSDGVYYWLASVHVKNDELIRNWTRFGISWHVQFGVWGLLDGIIVGVFLLPKHFSSCSPNP